MFVFMDSPWCNKWETRGHHLWQSETWHGVTVLMTSEICWEGLTDLKRGNHTKGAKPEFSCWFMSMRGGLIPWFWINRERCWIALSSTQPHVQACGMWGRGPRPLMPACRLAPVSTSTAVLVLLGGTCHMMMMIAFITVRSSLVPLIEGLCVQIYFRFEISVVCVHIFCFSFSEEKIC